MSLGLHKVHMYVYLLLPVICLRQVRTIDFATPPDAKPSPRVCCLHHPVGHHLSWSSSCPLPLHSSLYDSSQQRVPSQRIYRPMCMCVIFCVLGLYQTQKKLLAMSGDYETRRSFRIVALWVNLLISLWVYVYTPYTFIASSS